MVLKELLKTVNIEAILDAQDYPRIPDDVPREKQIEIYRKFIDHLLGLKEEPNKEGMVLLGIPITDDLDDFYPEPGIFVTAFKKEELLNSRKEAERILKEAPTADAPIEDIEQFTRGVDLPCGYGYEFTGWEEVLGWDVDESNLSFVGKDRFLASALYEMTFNGFTRESQEERRRDLEERIEELERMRELPEEEQKKHFFTHEEVMDELYADLGEEYTPPTEEEKKETRERMYREGLQNILAKASVVAGWGD